MSTLSYFFLVLGTTTTTNRNKIHVLQKKKKALRALANAPYDAHTEHIFHNLKLLSVQECCNSLLRTRHNISVKKNDSHWFDNRVTLTIHIVRALGKYHICKQDTGHMLRFNLPVVLNSSLT